MTATWAFSSFTIDSITFQDQNTVTFLGIDWCNGSRPLEVVVSNKRILVVKIPGGSHFASRGLRTTHPAEYYVYGILSETTDTVGRRVIKAVAIVHFPIRSKRVIEEVQRVQAAMDAMKMPGEEAA